MKEVSIARNIFGVTQPEVFVVKAFRVTMGRVEKSANLFWEICSFGGEFYFLQCHEGGVRKSGLGNCPPEEFRREDIPVLELGPRQCEEPRNVLLRVGLSPLSS